MSGAEQKVRDFIAALTWKTARPSSGWRLALSRTMLGRCCVMGFIEFGENGRPSEVNQMLLRVAEKTPDLRRPAIKMPLSLMPELADAVPLEDVPAELAAQAVDAVCESGFQINTFNEWSSSFALQDISRSMVQVVSLEQLLLEWTAAGSPEPGKFQPADDADSSIESTYRLYQTGQAVAWIVDKWLRQFRSDGVWRLAAVMPMKPGMMRDYAMEFVLDRPDAQPGSERVSASLRKARRLGERMWIEPASRPLIMEQDEDGCVWMSSLDNSRTLEMNLKRLSENDFAVAPPTGVKWSEAEPLEITAAGKRAAVAQWIAAGRPRIWPASALQTTEKTQT